MSDYKHSKLKRDRRRSGQQVGVRELKTHAANIVREVRESRASYVITHRGQPVGMILPLDPAGHVPESAKDMDLEASDAWAAYERAGRRIAGKFSADASGVQLLSDSRR
jgi:prevent-host-death family protein